MSTPLPNHRHHIHQALDGELRYMGHVHPGDDDYCRNDVCPDHAHGNLEAHGDEGAS
jgi:hypothetical protein